MSYTGTENTSLQSDNLMVQNLTLSNTKPTFQVNVRGDDFLKSEIQSLSEQIEQLKGVINDIKRNYIETGTIIPFGGSSIDPVTYEILPPPPNYDWCFGQIVSKTDERYSALYSAIGDYWNVSAELTDDQFQLPDLRNTFLRGCTTDPNDNYRLVGTHQACGVPNSKGTLYLRHPFDGVSYFTGPFSSMPSSYGTYCGFYSDGGYYYVSFDLSSSSSVYQDGLTEVRPDNKAVNYIIKL